MHANSHPAAKLARNWTLASCAVLSVCIVIAATQTAVTLIAANRHAASIKQIAQPVLWCLQQAGFEHFSRQANRTVDGQTVALVSGASFGVFSKTLIVAPRFFNARVPVNVTSY